LLEICELDYIVSAFNAPNRLFTTLLLNDIGLGLGLQNCLVHWLTITIFVAGGGINMIKSIKNSMNCGYVRDNKADLQQYLKIDLDKLLEDGTKEELRIPEVRVATQDFGFGVKLAHDLDGSSVEKR
jgi:hypothetical protein